jgi:predicted transcriptional regulator
VVEDEDWTAERLQAVLAALSNPHRLRVLAALSARRDYVSSLAREIGLSRPLLHMHLQKLEEAGLVAGTLELSEDGRAMKYFEVTDFSLELSPRAITRIMTADAVDRPRPPEEPNEQRGSGKP